MSKLIEMPSYAYASGIASRGLTIAAAPAALRRATNAAQSVSFWARGRFTAFSNMEGAWPLGLWAASYWFVLGGNVVSPTVAYIRLDPTVPRLEDGWHHYVWTYSGSRTAAGVKLYIDGQLTATTPSSPIAATVSINTPNVSADIGRTWNGAAFSYPDSPGGGQGRDVAYWSYELTAADALALYANGVMADVRAITVSGAAPVAFWRLSGSTADYGANKYNMTPVGFAAGAWVKAAPPEPCASSPLELGTPGLWFEADSADNTSAYPGNFSVGASRGSITTTLLASEISGAATPIASLFGYSSKPAPEFTTGKCWGSALSLAVWKALHDNTDATIYARFHYLGYNSAGANILLSTCQGLAANVGAHLFKFGSAGQMMADVCNGSALTTLTTANNVVATGMVSAFVLTKTAAGAWTAYDEYGGILGTMSVSSPSAASPSAELYFGNYVSALTLYSNMRVGQVVTYPAVLDATARAKLCGYGRARGWV